MNLSKKEKILIMLLVVVMVGGGFYMYIYSPKDKELAANKEYFKTADKDLKEAESTYNLVSGVGGITSTNRSPSRQRFATAISPPAAKPPTAKICSGRKPIIRPTTALWTTSETPTFRNLASA